MTMSKVRRGNSCDNGGRKLPDEIAEQRTIIWVDLGESRVELKALIIAL